MMEYARLNVRIGKKTMEGLDRLSDRYGMSKSGLVAYILGNYVSNHEQIMSGLPERLQGVLVESLQRADGSDLEPRA